ncbi:MAG: dethiobiotin synthase [Paramuribaculum sp.]|nr:ATP-dependent dethiobiotin synthetase BioD [Bacteroides sp.]MBD5320240.1 ATP-dependent dethiobiotin synthetase BioD [Bacteroides sp.]MDE6051943.1 dethiobiotin synthase [Paramuribaculum sp.]
MAEIIFISGIDTDAGKSYATGFLARLLAEEGKKVVTQKFIQTGNTGFSEDIELHRLLTATGPLEADRAGLTAPIILSYPASAQLAARLDGVEIDLSLIDNATARLAEEFDTVLIEGAGGLMVPITDDFFAIDYCVTRRLPVALVTNSRLGSINHTILSLEAIKSRGLKLHSVLYNTYFDKDPVISADTRAFIERYVRRHFPETPILDIPSINI